MIEINKKIKKIEPILNKLNDNISKYSQLSKDEVSGLEGKNTESSIVSIIK